MQIKRRDFIKTATVLGSGLALSSYLPSCRAAASMKTIRNNFGLALYTLKDVLPKNPKEVLTEVASYGYKKIESYEHDKLGIFWGMKNTEFKKLMDDLGMQIVSSHCDTNKDFERKAAEAGEIGMKYLIFPYEGTPFGKNEEAYKTMPKTIDEFKRMADSFNKKGEVCKKNNLRFAYHNHDYTFSTLDNQFPEEILIQNTDPSLVDFEMDMYWVVTAGQDPISWLNKYPNRFKLCHIKDRKKTAASTERSAFTELGTGSIDYKHILKEAAKKGMEHFFVEQDGTTLAAAKANADYMKTLD